MSSAANQEVVEGERQAVPDSTTKERGERNVKENTGFTEGEDVLVMHKDGRFYLGTVVEIHLSSEKCLVKFGDGTERWSIFKDITRLSVPENDTVACVICKSSKISSDDNDIVVCDKCARGYHQKCHKPAVDSEELDWKCHRCQSSTNENCHPSSSSSSSFQTVISPKTTDTFEPKNSSLPPQVPTELPYDLNDLVWDIEHTMNTSQQYCYCGKKGDWFVKMIQCGRCLQWFHEKCVHCLIYPLYLGDRFYVFVCSICNLGEEFVRRLELKWVDVVHLVIFNLIAYHAKRYYDLDTDIVKYANSHWHMLQLPPKMYNVSLEERKNNIVNVLTNYKHRFKRCSKPKKRSSWGLRNRDPPNAPQYTLPSSSFPITDKILKNAWKDNKRLRTFFCVNGESVVYNSKKRPPNVPNGIKPSEAGLKLLRISSTPLVLPKGVPATGHKVCIKSATPFRVQKSAVQRRILKQQQEAESSADKRRLRSSLTAASVTSNKKQTKSSLSNRTSRNADNEIRVKNETNSSTQPQIQVELPPTPPSSISAPETPPQQPLLSVSNSEFLSPPIEDTNSGDSVDTFSSNAEKTAINIDALLASITIPNAGCKAEPLEEEDIKPQITLPLSLKNVVIDRVMKPMKRRLSEKDIIVTENGEVKRKRIRRQASLLGNKFKYHLNSTIPKKCSEESMVQQFSPPKKTPCSSSSAMVDDFRSSVYAYFGAPTRIASGEEYTVLGKRRTLDGNVQYLIEWKNTHIL